MAPGPFPVGLKTLTLNDPARIDEKTGKPRALVCEIWYPAEQRYRDGPFFTYDLKAEALEQDLGDKKQTVLDTEVPNIATLTIRDAEIDRARAPYPIVFFVHGAYGIRWQSIFYTIQLASHGYVVVAADHQNNTIWDMIRDGYQDGAVTSSALIRLDDMKFLLDTFMDKDEEYGDFFFATIDKQRVGISGHSFGGWTATAMPCRDPRYKAVVPQSPVIYLAAGVGCDLAQYPVPILVMHGNRDNTVPFKDTWCDFRIMGGAERMLYELDRGGHFTFADICDLDLAYLAERLGIDTNQALEDGCSPTENIPWHEAHKTINHYATAHFNVHLRGSEGSRAFLVEHPEPPFDTVTLHAEVPDWPDGGCPK
jgi:predicted dienelactone hydrolase